MLRYGVIGTGWITRSMIDGASRYPELLRLTAVCSRTRERARSFAAEVGAPLCFDSAEAMAASDAVDMVYIASPNRCHAAQARLFLEHGTHVLCEKPLSAFPWEVEALQQTAQQRGLLFREAIMLLYQPQLAVLESAAAACGRIGTAHFQFCQLSSKYEAYQRGETPNIFCPALHTGALMDLGVYCVYPALRLFGEPRRIQASAGFLRTGADGFGSALLDYGDKLVTLTYNKTGEGAAPSEIVGDAGTVTVQSIAKLGDIRLRLRGQEERLLYGTDEKPVLMGREIAAFAAAAQDGAVPDEHESLALAVSRTMYAIRRLAGIRFPEDGAAFAAGGTT